jgi:hypothetical protein
MAKGEQSDKQSLGHLILQVDSVLLEVSATPIVNCVEEDILRYFSW